MRFNKIYAGPAEEVRPYVIEALAAEADLKPGQIVTFVGGKFDHAGVATQTQILVLQENYLAMLGVDDLYQDEETAIGMIPLPDKLFNCRFAATAALVQGDAIALAASGLLRKLPAGAGTYVVVGYADETITIGATEDLARVRFVSPRMVTI